jgi:hypothetical protein
MALERAKSERMPLRVGGEAASRAASVGDLAEDLGLRPPGGRAREDWGEATVGLEDVRVRISRCWW